MSAIHIMPEAGHLSQLERVRPVLQDCRHKGCFGTRRPSLHRCSSSAVNREGACFLAQNNRRSIPCRAEHGGDSGKLSPQVGFTASIAAALALSALLPKSSLAANNGLFAIADIDPKTAGLIAAVLSPVLTLAILLFIFRIPMSWYPNLNFRKFPWALIVVPTEPVLGPTRRAVPPVGGVDIAPIIWVAVLSFLNEILLGPQGILNLIQRQLQL